MTLVLYCLRGALEQVSGRPLGKLAQMYLFKPLKMSSSGFIDLQAMKNRRLEIECDAIVPTAMCSWRKKVLCGEVYNENAWAMGGTSGHAGLFTTAADINRLVVALIESWHGKGELVSKKTIRTFWSEGTPSREWALGWKRNLDRKGAEGQHLSSAAIGHSAETGCSVWIDPEKQLSCILLGSTRHLYGDHGNFVNQVVPGFHKTTMEILG